jgi:hypothetical protein
MELGPADDGGGDQRLAQHPGQGDLGHWNATFLRDLLNRFDDGLFDVELEAFCDPVGIATPGVLAPGACEAAFAQRDHGI